MGGKILISACLMGAAVRYDGTDKKLHHPVIAQWHSEGRLVPICPEVSAGLPVPRPPVEIAASASGQDVLAGRARVFEKTGADMTETFIIGARAALALARKNDCSFALLIDGSP